MPSLRRGPLLAVGALWASLAVPARAQKFEGTVTITDLQFDESFIYHHAANDGEDVRGVLDVSMANLMDADRQLYDVDKSTTVLRIRGREVRAELEGGMYMILDAESGQLTMARQGEFFAAFTGDELEQEMAAMMGGGPGGGLGDPGAARQAMGAHDAPLDVDGPKTLGRRGELNGTGCEWLEAVGGDVASRDGMGALEPAVLMQACVTQDHEAAWESYRYLQERMSQMPFGDDEEDELENRIATAVLERGLPILTKTMQRGAGMTSGLTFHAVSTEVVPGPVSDTIFTEHQAWERLPLREFFMRMMGGGVPKD